MRMGLGKTRLDEAADTTPNQFYFDDVPNAAISTVYTSNTITVSGMTGGVVAAFYVTGGDGAIAVVNGVDAGTFGLVTQGDTVAIRVTSSASYLATVDGMLTINGVSKTFSVTNAASPGDTTAPTVSGLTASGKTDSAALFQFTSDEANGLVYWYASSSATPPSAANLISGSGSLASGNFTVPAAMSGTLSGWVTGLTYTASTRYVHVLQRDNAGNNSAILTQSFTLVATLDETYYSILSEPLGRLSTSSQQGVIDWAGQSWAQDSGAGVNDSMGHAIQLSGKNSRVRFTVKNTVANHPSGDLPGVRRSELDSKNTLVDGTPYWGAQSVITDSWVQPTSVAQSTSGYKFMQIHTGSGGSPGFALGIAPDGRFRITRSEVGDANIEIYDSAWVFDVPHHVLYRFKLSTLTNANGEAEVWVDGMRVLNISGVKIGLGSNTGYMKCGIYASGSLGPDTTAEVSVQLADVVRPATTSLASLVTSPPSWPQDLLGSMTNVPAVRNVATSNTTGTGNVSSFVPSVPTHIAGDGLIYVVSMDDNDPSATPTVSAGYTNYLTITGTSGRSSMHIIYYGSGGTMTPAPSGAVPAPTVALTTERASAVAYSIDLKGQTTTIEGAGAQFNSSLANPPSHTLAGGERAALWIAGVGVDQNTLVSNIVSLYPPGYSNGARVDPASGSGSSTTAAAARQLRVATEDPSSFALTGTREGVAATIALSNAA